MTAVPHRLWQLAGAFCLAHVALIPVGLSLQQGPLLDDGLAGITDAYVEGDMTRVFTGGVLESVGFLLMIPALVFLARVLGRRTEAGAWAAQTGLLCGVAYVAVTFAVGFPAGAVAMYGAQHGLDLDARDVDAALADDVLLAIDEVEVAVLVEAAEITGEEPSVTHGRRVRLVVLDIAAEVDAVDAERDLAHFARLHFYVVLVGNANGNA